MPRNKVVDIKGDVAVSVYDLPVDEIQLALPRPQDEDIPPLAKKKPRLEEPFPTTADEATTENTSHGTTAALPRDAADDADSDHVMDTQPNDGATRSTGRWTPEEDVKKRPAYSHFKDELTEICRLSEGHEHAEEFVASCALPLLRRALSGSHSCPTKRAQMEDFSRQTRAMFSNGQTPSPEDCLSQLKRMLLPKDQELHSFNDSVETQPLYKRKR
jgi:hypothetical protein